jgi:FAD/FMN-containing dehydrogenase
LIGEENVCLPGNPGYDMRRRVWNGMIDRRPAVIARPGTAQQVVGLVLLCREAGLSLVVRGGGHSFPGFSTCDDGLVLDLSRLDRIVVDPVARVAEVGGGELLGDLDRATAPHGLVTPAGLVSHTGAGGLTLGGGMGWTSRRLGLTIDNLLLVELVTADGSIVEVTPTSDPDLFWGLCGGGGNFGVVTRFHFHLHQLGPITIGKWSYPLSRSAEALGELAELGARAPRSQTSVVNITRDGLTVTAFHSGPDGLGNGNDCPPRNPAWIPGHGTARR